jgi:glucose-1-phosphate adenylyltransferase
MNVLLYPSESNLDIHKQQKEKEMSGNKKMSSQQTSTCMVPPPLLCLVLAGGRGSRLLDLTKNRCKPAMPVCKYTFLDFCLGNIRNSRNIDRTYVLTQYMPDGITTHLANYGTDSSFWGKFIRALPAQQPAEQGLYVGNANAVYQNYTLVRKDPADYVLVLAADHLYKMDYSQFLAHHIRQKGEQEGALTVCGRFVPLSEAAGQLGVIEIDENFRIIGFEEKPENPKEYGNTGTCFASMGIYVGDKEFLFRELEEDNNNVSSAHDFGGNVIPQIIEKGLPLFAYDHGTNYIPGEMREENGVLVAEHKWVDLGTVDAYFDAMMDLVSTEPKLLNLYNKKWPIMSVWDGEPMAKVISPGDDRKANCGPQYMSAGGTIITSPDRNFMTMIGRSVRIDPGAHVTQSVMFDDVHVCADAVVTKSILEEGVIVPPGCVIGEDEDDDRDRGIYITEKGVRVVMPDTVL